MVQKYIFKKGEFHLCDESTVISDFETGEIFCSKCGVVLSERVVDSGPDWHSFSERLTVSGFE